MIIRVKIISPYSKIDNSIVAVVVSNSGCWWWRGGDTHISYDA